MHKPWEAPTQVLQAAGVLLGKTYPNRIISDLKVKAERSKSVEAVLKIRRANQESNSDRGYDMIAVALVWQTTNCRIYEYEEG